MKKILDSLKFLAQLVVAVAALAVVILLAGILARACWFLFKFGWSWLSI